MAFKPCILTPEQVDEEYRQRLVEREQEELRAWFDLKEREAVVNALKDDLQATLGMREKERQQRISEAQEVAMLLEAASARKEAEDEGSNAGDQHC